MKLILFFLFSITPNYLFAQWIDQGPGGESLASISFLDANNGWACGLKGTILRTQDGGASWQKYIINSSTARNNVRAIANPQERRVVLILETPSPSQPEGAYVSQNNGASWQAIDFGTFNNLYFYDGDKGLLVGDGGTLRFSEGGGFLWVPVASGTQNNLRDATCASPQDCYVVGDGGALRKSSNGLNNAWRALNSTTSARLNGVHFSSATQGYIVGDNGTALRTINAGLTWTPMPVGTNVNLNDVYFLNPTVGFIAGELGTVLLTTNGGTSWRAETTNTFESLYSITAAADGSVTRIAGGGGTVLKRGPVVLGSKAAGVASEWQAYPNPFGSTLQLTLPTRYQGESHIQLLNTQGEIVYTKTFTTADPQQELQIPTTLPGGVYIVQLRNGQQVETRRLVHLP